MGRGGCDKTAIVPALICMAILYIIVSGVCIFLAVLLSQNEEASRAFGDDLVRYLAAQKTLHSD